MATMLFVLVLTGWFYLGWRAFGYSYAFFTKSALGCMEIENDSYGHCLLDILWGPIAFAGVTLTGNYQHGRRTVRMTPQEKWDAHAARFGAPYTTSRYGARP